MRITLTLDSDMHAWAKALAREQGRTMSEIVSEYARKGLADYKPDEARKPASD